eukprot:scaffold12049_cov141-Skeletonema_menzelii.AAC.4
MTFTPLKRLIWLFFIATLLCCAYYQLFSRTIITTDGPNAQEIIAAAEAIRNAAVAQPHKFGIQKEDVRTLRVADSVPSSMAGVRHVYIAQEVGGVPISNTLLSTVVKLAPSSSDGESIDGANYNYLRASADKYATSSKKSTTYSNDKGDIVEMVSLKHGQALVKNADNCVNTNIPVLSAEEALSMAVNEVLGIKNANFRRRNLKADDVGNNNNKDVRQKSIFEPHHGISINDTPCQLSYWSTLNSEDNCDVRLCWECTIKSNRTNYMHIFVDSVEGSIINLSKFGPSNENDDNEKDNEVGNDMQQHTDPSRRRLSAFSAVQYPKENPCPSCPRFGTRVAGSDRTFDVADIEPLTLVQSPEFLDSSPNGWLKIGDTTYDETRGNNARAAFSVDQDISDPYASGVTAFATDSSSNVFDYSHQSIVNQNNVGLEKQVSASLEAAVVNAFYWANIIHDIFYQYGFNEESGNFQEENFGRGGKGGDSVIVEVRETNVFNNAFFVNGRDGENPLLLLYLFLKSDETLLEVDGEEYKAAPFAFGPTEFNLPDAPIVSSIGRECQYLKDNVYAGSIVVIDGGTCSFSTKVRAAQNRGASAVILVVDSWDRPAFSMADADASIYVPSVSITKEDAEHLLASIQPASKGSLGPGLIVRDGAFDSSIIIHEYCHGITARLTGGPSTTFCLNEDTSRELGKEGWEDICSLFVTATNTTGRTRTIGSFASWSLFGIRPFPYSTDMTINPTTYGRLNTNPGSHFLGTIFGSMLWELYWGIIDYEEGNGRLGFNENKYDSQTGGSNIAMQLIMEGLKIQPCSPSFVQSRDAILLADLLLYDGEYKCVIWDSFAKRGVGESAVASPLGATLNVTEAFDVPAYCMGPTLSLASHNYSIFLGDGDSFIDDCESFSVSVTVQNTGFGNLTDLQLVGVTSNSGAAILLNQFPMKLLDLSEMAQTSVDVDLKIDGLVLGQPLELEATFTASEAADPLSVMITFSETSTDIVAEEKVIWDFREGDHDWTGIDGYFSLEPSRSPLTVGNVAYYSPVANFGKIHYRLSSLFCISTFSNPIICILLAGPQKFSIENAFIQEGGLGCEEVEDGTYAGSVVLIERGECDFSTKAQNAQNGGALGVIISNYVNEYPFNLGEQNPDIIIPVVMVGYTAGQRIKQRMWYKDLATLSYDAERKEIFSSHRSLPEQCNRVRSPPFVLYDNSEISMWVSFGISGVADDSVYDRANVGLFSKGKRVSIAPDGGHRYNSYGVVNTKNVETCPAPGKMGWRKGTGSTFKKVVFSADVLQDTKLIGEIVELDIAISSGEETHGSFFSIKKVELTNVGFLMPDEGTGLCSTSPSTASLPPFSSLPPPLSEDQDLGLNFTFTTSSAPDGSSAQEQGGINPGKDGLIEDNTNQDEGQSRDGGIGAGGLVFVITFFFAIPVAVAYFHFIRRRRRKAVRNFCESEIANGSDLENPMHVLDAVEVSLNTAVVPASALKEEEQNESQIKGSQSDTTEKRTFSARTESSSSSSASSSASEEGEGGDDASQCVQTDDGDDFIEDDELIEYEGASQMISFINIFLM